MLVGDEMEGIPAEYIVDCVDQIVQLPQEGAVKSMNSHVMVSMCIWEYNSQHMPKQNAS